MRKIVWILASDRLPSIGERVLGYWPNSPAGVQVREMRYGIPKTAKRPYWLWNNRVTKNEISHWMPLPDPPLPPNAGGNKPPRDQD